MRNIGLRSMKPSSLGRKSLSHVTIFCVLFRTVMEISWKYVLKFLRNIANRHRNNFFIEGLYSLSGRTIYRQITEPRSRETARLDAIMFASLWNLTGISAALLPRCLSNFVSERLEKYKPESRGFETSRDLVVRRPPAQWIKALAEIRKIITCMETVCIL